MNLQAGAGSLETICTSKADAFPNVDFLCVYYIHTHIYIESGMVRLWLDSMDL